jgi:hypothetical protein
MAVNDALLGTLLIDIKNYLDITWEDAQTNSKLTGIIKRGISYIDRAAGAEQDYTKEDKAKELLLDYCRYVRSNALSEFQTNYLSELLTLQIKQEVATYEAENPDTDL